MIDPSELIHDLRAHWQLGQELLALIQEEGELLQTSGSNPSGAITESKRILLPRLKDSLDKIRKHRHNWQQLTASQRASFPEIALLLRQNQDLIMKIIVLDRENEQTLLRRGLIPAHHLPPVNRQRPRVVVDLYRRNGSL